MKQIANQQRISDAVALKKGPKRPPWHSTVIPLVRQLRKGQGPSRLWSRRRGNRRKSCSKKARKNPPMMPSRWREEKKMRMNQPTWIPCLAGW